MWASGARGHGPKCLRASQAQTWQHSRVGPRTFSTGATDHPQWHRTQSTAYNGASMDNGSSGLQKARCWVWTGESVPLCLVLPLPKGCIEFLGKPRRRGSWPVLGTARPPMHISQATTWREGGTGKMFLESFIGASVGYGWEL